ncbi:hypothetical protein [Maridesulfovibrio sp.]|uniref:hypothetical protein n=1 Tax=Maridesulfovibrio sp. TaxID=2795000 RepID=UPI0029C9C19E|nr:hypothetical protein [Maridesulfovibrio sp.]
MADKKFNSTAFRKELVKIMPGYKWTVHRAENPKEYITATGIKTAGFNRTSTLEVVRREHTRFGKPGIEYTVRSAGFGLKARWLAEKTDGTLARALRELQSYYEYTAQEYSSGASDLESARKVKDAA